MYPCTQREKNPYRSLKPARSEQGVEPFWFNEIGKFGCFISALCTVECDTEAERLSLHTKALRLLPWGTKEEL